MKVKGFLVESGKGEEWLVSFEDGALSASRAGRVMATRSGLACRPAPVDLDHGQMQQVTAAVILELNRFFARLPRLPRSSAQGRRTVSRLSESQASS